MQLPTFASSEFTYLSSMPQAAAVEALLAHGKEHTLRFFIEGCEDRTWILATKGGVIKPLGALITEWFWLQKLTSKELEKISQAIQGQFLALEPYLVKDLELVVEKDIYSVNSLIFLGHSPYFRDLAMRQVAKEGKRRVELKGIHSSFFTFIWEYLYQGELANLWKEEPERILDVIRLASRLGLTNMAAFSAGVYKRYLAYDNAADHLLLAAREGLIALSVEAATFLSQRVEGLGAEEKEGLSLTIQSLSLENQETIKKLIPIIKEIHLKEPACADAALVPLIKAMRPLRRIDISATKSVLESLLEALPYSEELNLASCSWLSDALFFITIRRCPRISRLNLSHNFQLTLRSWGELANYPGLTEINLSQCSSIDDDDLDLIVSSIPQAMSLCLDDCTKLTDQGIEAIARQCRSLEELSLNGCLSLVGTGVVEIVTRCSSLKELSLQRCRGLRPELIASMQKLNPRLKIEL